MIRRSTILALLAALSLVAGCSAENEPGGDAETTAAPAAEPTEASLDAAAMLAEVAAAMGAADLESITYSGTAWRIRNSFRQTPNASPPWPSRDEITSYRRAIDLSRPASLALGETFAQNLFLEPAEEGTYVQNVPADQTSWARQLEIWLTPWGFLAGAEANGVEADRRTVDGSEHTVLSWRSPETQTAPSGLRYRVNGYVNDENLIERVETWVEDPFMGDMHVETVYGGYESMNGLMVPTTMEQRRGNGGIFGATVAEARADPSDLAELLTMPEGVGSGGFPGGLARSEPPEELAEEIGDGVWLIHGGYVALVAEFEDHVLVFEGGQSEARGEQIVEEINRVLPDKPIRYVVNSHPHSDHTAGLVPFVREGATIVTHSNNVDFLNMALSTPRTLLGEETLSPRFEGVDGVGVYEDATMRVELHHVPNLHSDGMLVAFLPEQRILFQADFSLPLEGAEPNPFVVTLAEYIEEAGLDFDRYLAVHAAPVPQTKADLMAALD